jgi:hypothetical protein
MRKIALSAKAIGGFGIDATYWFDTISKKLGLLNPTSSSNPKNNLKFTKFL